jgi:hypothetical protein
MRPVRNLTVTLPFAFLLISLLFLTNAFAATHGQIRAFMAKRYDPNITYFASDDGLSGFQCKLQRVFVTGKDPVSQASRYIDIKHYIPGAGMPNSGRAVIILPPTGGENVLDNKWANTLCKRGFRVAILQRWELLPEEQIGLSMYDRMSLRALVAVLHTSEYFAHTGAKSIGLLGTSLGAIQGAAAVGFDPKIKAATLIVGGIGLHEILANSDEQGITALRDARMQLWGTKLDAYQAALDKAISIEPGDFIGFSGPKKVLSIVALKDKTVPTANQMKMYDAFGKQELITLNKDHFGAVKHTGIMLSGQVSEFFDKNL